MKEAPPPLRLRITSDPANLAPVRHAIEALCGASGFDATASGEIGLVVNEALANITRHAYGGATDGPIQLEAELIGDVLRITLRDWGCGRLPPDQTEPDPSRPGGLGLVCLRKLMDEARFEAQPDGMLLTLTRKRR